MKLKTNKVWKNTIKKYGGKMPYYAIPKSLDDLIELVKRAEQENKRLKAVGSGHSFSDVAVPETYLVDLKKLNQLLPLDTGKLNAKYRTTNLVHVEGGMTIQRFNKRMDKKNLCVANMGGIDNQTLAGAVSTGTHGTGLNLPSFPGMVRSILLVTAGGKCKRIEPNDGVTNPDTHDEAGVELVQNDEIFNSALISLGCFGVIYSFILEMEDMYYLSESKTCMQWSEVKPLLADRSLFLEEDKLTPIRGVMVQINPYENDEGDHTCTIVRHHMLNGKPKKRGIGAATRNWISSILGRLPITFMILKKVARKAPEKLPGMLDNSLKSLQDKKYLNKGYKVLYQGAEYVKIRAYDSEFAFDMTDFKNDFIKAVEEIFEKAKENRAKKRYQTAPLGLRFVDQSPAYLSPEYGKKVAYIDTPFILGSPLLDDILFEYQEIMLANNGIPHWGKINTILDGKTELLEQFYPEIDKWKEVFHQFNPNDTFSNKFSDRMKLGEVKQEATIA